MDTNSYKNALNELESLKNKALGVQSEINAGKEASLTLSEELGQKEVSAIAKYAQDAAMAKIDAIQKVDAHSESRSKKFLSDWSNAFGIAGTSAKDFGTIAQDALSKLGGELSTRIFGDGPVGEALSGTFGSLLSNVFGGYFADGGRPPQNRVSVVGERGPELFVPDSAGTVVPNEEISKSNPVVVYQSFTFQSLDPATNMKLLQSQKDQIQSWVVDGIKNNQNGLRNMVKSV